MAAHTSSGSSFQPFMFFLCAMAALQDVFAQPSKVASLLNVTMQLAGNPKYTALLEAIQREHLDQEIVSHGQPLTLLAPTNAAMESLASAVQARLQRDHTTSYVLRFHVVLGYYKHDTFEGLPGGSTVASLAGPRLNVTGGLPRGAVQFGIQDYTQASLVDPDVVDNGLLSVQGVDHMLLPEGIAPAESPTAAPIPVVALTPAPLPKGGVVPAAMPPAASNQSTIGGGETQGALSSAASKTLNLKAWGSNSSCVIMMALTLLTLAISGPMLQK